MTNTPSKSSDDVNSVPKQLKNSSTLFNHRHRFLALSLLPLHFAIWIQENLSLANTLFLIHIGIFIVWQPFINSKTQIQTRPTIVLLLAIFAITYLGGGWALAIWVIFLTGILSSYRLPNKLDKFIFYTAIIFLMVALFGGLIPKLITFQQVEEYSYTLVNYLGIILLAIILLTPGKTSDLKNYSSDLLYSFMTVVIVILIALTTLLWMLIGGYSYLESLILSFISLAAVLIAFNLAFRPNSDFGLFSQYRDRYLLNLGSPFEYILQQLADISQREDSPASYLESAFEELLDLDWINGFRWDHGKESYTNGFTSEHVQRVAHQQLDVAIYTQQELSTAMQVHAKLIIQIVNIFYQAKVREVTLSRQAHMSAIHETGARLTHDIKNLVQSLTLMITTANTLPPSEASDQLFKRNLEIITARLQKTLSKLKNPDSDSEVFIPISAWWHNIAEQYTASDIKLIKNIDYEFDIPSEAFTNMLDNLHDNAKKKQLNETEISFTLSIVSTESRFYIEYKDNGSAIPVDIVGHLLDAPINSKSGFGIGLYQATQQLQKHGFDLVIFNNEDKDVCFRINKTNQINY